METRRIPEEAQAETQPRTSRKETILIEKKPKLVPEHLIGLQKLTTSFDFRLISSFFPGGIVWVKLPKTRGYKSQLHFNIEPPQNGFSQKLSPFQTEPDKVTEDKRNG